MRLLRLLFICNMHFPFDIVSFDPFAHVHTDAHWNTVFTPSICKYHKWISLCWICARFLFYYKCFFVFTGFDVICFFCFSHIGIDIEIETKSYLYFCLRLNVFNCFETHFLDISNIGRCWTYAGGGVYKKGSKNCVCACKIPTYTMNVKNTYDRIGGKLSTEKKNTVRLQLDLSWLDFAPFAFVCCGTKCGRGVSVF